MLALQSGCLTDLGLGFLSCWVGVTGKKGRDRAGHQYTAVLTPPLTCTANVRAAHITLTAPLPSLETKSKLRGVKRPAHNCKGLEANSDFSPFHPKSAFIS